MKNEKVKVLAVFFVVFPIVFLLVMCIALFAVYLNNGWSDCDGNFMLILSAYAGLIATHITVTVTVLVLITLTDNKGNLNFKMLKW